jgi:hypothetical protein
MEARFPGFHVPDCVRQGRLPSFRKAVKVEHGADGVALVTIFRPEAKNALNKRTLGELASAMAELEADAAVEAVVLTSAGGGLAGADILELAALPDAAACESICHYGHSSPWPATRGWWAPPSPSASPRSTSASSRATGGPSACPVWWA